MSVVSEPDVFAEGLPGRVLAFTRALRASGASVSAAEVRDALEAVRALPPVSRDRLRACLAATMLKDETLRDAFDRMFDIYFPLRRASRAGAGDGGVDDDAEDVADALRSGDSDRLRDLARDRVDRHGDVQPQADVNEDAYVYRALRGLNLDAIRSQLQEDEVEGRGLTSLNQRIVHEDMTERLEAFRQMLRDEIFSRLVDEVGSEEMAARQRRPAPEEVDFLWASESDLERMRATLVPLARKLTQRLSHRRRTARRGRLDVRRTIRRSLSAGGALVEPRFRRAIAGKPELVVVCDISGSMRAFAKFALELVYSLATQFQRVRSFVFVDALDEVTHVFDATGDFPTALARLDGEADVVTLDGQSWYGNCLEQFWERAGRDLAPRTTVIIVGDGRNNFRTTGVEALHRVHERVRKLYWLNPEPRENWDAGDSVMGEFEPACDAVYEVRNLRQLEDFVSRAL